jgi:hypothetical protein
MKHSVFSATLLTLLASHAFAGTRTSGTQSATQPGSHPLAFSANETQIDVFDTYLDGKGPDHAGPFREHGWGGGVGLNHFWLENVGVGIDVAGIHGRENPSLGNSSKTLVQSTASVILRLPYQEYNLAPYTFLGAGITGRAGNWASAHAGLGIEYRVVPNQVGIFTDARWTYYGDANGHGDLNNFQARAGVRFAF